MALFAITFSGLEVSGRAWDARQHKDNIRTENPTMQQLFPALLNNCGRHKAQNLTTFGLSIQALERVIELHRNILPRSHVPRKFRSELPVLLGRGHMKMASPKGKPAYESTPATVITAIPLGAEELREAASPTASPDKWRGVQPARGSR